VKLKIIRLKDIKLGDRIRKEYGDINELILSFEKEGIIQPLAVKDKKKKGEKYLLLAGGRRLLAAEKAGILEVPVRIYEKDLTGIEIKSIELAENIYRKDLEWQEEVKIKKEIWELQKEIYGEKTTKNPDDPGTSKREVAKLIGDSASIFSEDVILAQVAEGIPQLQQAKTKTEAKKIFNKLKEDLIKQEISKRIEENKAKSSPDQARELITNGYILNDFFEGIKKVGDKTVDIVEIDPPYGIDLTEQKKSSDSIGLSTINYNEVEAKEYKDFMTKVVKECYRVMKNNSWLIMWFGPDPWFQTIHNIMTDIGLKGNALPAIWTKGQGQTMAPNYYMGNAYEMFFYMRKGDIKLNQKGRSNIFNFKPVSPARKTHPTERPIEMMEEVLDVFGYKGSTVLVPFLGSGNTLLAANNKDMSGFGFELSSQYKDNFIIKVHEQRPGNFRSY
jgi:site-specific DNA-methyltransferase (adenine-specific)